jgi:arylsulfatase A-like enzyme
MSFDQMRGDYIQRFGATWGERGFNRLVREGAYFPNCYFHHASNITAPGHAVHLTGCYPHKTGIVSNDFYDRKAGRELYCVQDTLHKTFGLSNPKEWHSPANLKATTLGTYLKRVSPRSKVIGVSQKDRAAIVMSGHNADAAYWFEYESGGYTTSDYYFKELPTWLQDWNTAHHMTAYSGKIWNTSLSDPAFAVPDSMSFEAMPKGQFTFPYVLPPADSLRQLNNRFLLSPFGVEHLFSFTRSVFEREELGKRGTTDLLCLSVSTTDYVGHQFGPQSREIIELYTHIDRYVGEFLDFLDANVGKGQYTVVITSDHGVAPVPEFIKLKEGSAADAGRLKGLEIIEFLEQGLKSAFPQAAVEKWIKAFEAPSIFLSDQALKALKRRVVLDSARSILQRFTGIGIVLTDEQLRSNRPPKDVSRADFDLVRNDFFLQRTGEIVLYPKRNWIMANITATHGTPHDYDRHVPMVLLNAGLPSGTHQQRVTPADIAPTLARMLRLKMKNVDGKAISVQ